MYMHVYMHYQFMKEEAVDFMEGGKGHLGVFEGSEAGRSVIIILPQRKKNHGQQSSKDAKGEREKGGKTLDRERWQSQKTSIPQSECSVIVSETCGWMSEVALESVWPLWA